MRFEFATYYVCWQPDIPLHPQPATTMPKAATKPKAPLPPSQIETRVKNKGTHPGLALIESPSATPKPKRRSKAQVKQAKETKALAKQALAEAKQLSINRAAEFEQADIANEDMVDATPRPIFTPKPRPLSRNTRIQKPSSLTSVADTSDIGVSDDRDETPFMPVSDSENLAVDADGWAAETDDPPPPPPPPQKKKAKITQKATAAVDTNTLGGKADRKRRVVDVEGEVPVDNDEEQPQEPKPKKVKVKMRDEIDVAKTKIVEEGKEGNKYAKMVNSMGSSGKPASKVPSHSSQSKAVGGKPLKREGAIADIKALVQVGGKKSKKERAIADISHPDKSTTLNFPNSSSTRPDPDNNNNVR